MLPQLTPALFQNAVEELATNDADLAQILALHGMPPFWQRDPGFPSLVYIILEQQVSLASARATYQKLCDSVPDLTPESFLTQDEESFRAIGFSRQKTTCTRHLAQAIVDGTLDLDALAEMEDNAVHQALTRIKGIGDWTATIYQMMALRHPDVWPYGDRALAVAVQQVKRLEKTPDHETLIEIGNAYRPWRSVAARLFWYHYLDGNSPV